MIGYRFLAAVNQEDSVDFVGRFWWHNVRQLAVDSIKSVHIEKMKQHIMLEFNFLKQYFCSRDYGLCNKLDFSYLAGSLVLQPSGEAVCSSIADLFKLNLYKSLLN